jgi:acyl-CoA reductase-like NAD-dependent aldehyde dehydrogenase
VSTIRKPGQLFRITSPDELAPIARNENRVFVSLAVEKNSGMQSEVFGPILPILTYRTLDEALARIAATPHPLAAFVFSRDQKTIDRFVGELSYGGGAVNQVNIHLFIESMPFGGTGAAGVGHYYGKYGFDMLTHAKSMLVSPPDVAIDHLFPPYTKAKNEALALWFEY